MGHHAPPPEGCKKHHLINCTDKYALECIINDKKIGNEELGIAAEWYRTIAHKALEQGRKADEPIAKTPR